MTISQLVIALLPPTRFTRILARLNGLIRNKAPMITLKVRQDLVELVKFLHTFRAKKIYLQHLFDLFEDLGHKDVFMYSTEARNTLQFRIFVFNLFVGINYTQFI